MRIRIKVRADQLEPGDRLVNRILEPTVRYAFESKDYPGQWEVAFTHSPARRFNASTLLLVERDTQ